MTLGVCQPGPRASLRQKSFRNKLPLVVGQLGARRVGDECHRGHWHGKQGREFEEVGILHDGEGTRRHTWKKWDKFGR